MPARIVWSASAQRDLERLHGFLRDISPDKRVAKRAIQAIVQGARVLSDFPLAGVLMDASTGRREFHVAFASSGYTLRYSLEENGDVVIFRVYHQREQRLH